MNAVSTPAEFYDALAPRYDGMINFSARLESETHLLQPFVDEFNIRLAADMGCGTGLHVFALSKLGVAATGFDISSNMLHAARLQQAELGLPAHFIPGSFLAPELQTAAPLDAVFCLGNSIPHVADIGELKQILVHWKHCLRPGGVIVIQLLNYQRILRSKDRIVGIRKIGPATTIRFYDFTEPRLTFNILTIQEDGARVSHDLQSTLLLPLTKNDFALAASETGFPRLDCFGSLQREPFSDDAKDLVIVLHE